VGGRIVERLVNIGDHVDSGTLLARLDPTQEQADVSAAEANLSAAKAQARQAASTLERQQTLLDKGFTTRSSYDRAREQDETSKEAVAAAEAALEIARSNLTYTELHAESAGIITARNADVGEIIQPAYPMFTLARDGPRDALFEVDESMVLVPLANYDVRLSLVGNRDVTTTGEIREVAPSINTATGTINVKIGIDSPPSEMTLGSLVVGEADLTPEPAIRLPWTALGSIDGKASVWVVDPEALTVSQKQVDILSYESDFFYVRDGLNEGELVVTEGVKLITPGEKVSLENDGQ